MGPIAICVMHLRSAARVPSANLEKVFNGSCFPSLFHIIQLLCAVLYFYFCFHLKRVRNNAIGSIQFHFELIMHFTSWERSRCDVEFSCNFKINSRVYDHRRSIKFNWNTEWFALSCLLWYFKGFLRLPKIAYCLFGRIIIYSKWKLTFECIHSSDIITLHEGWGRNVMISKYDIQKI